MITRANADYVLTLHAGLIGLIGDGKLFVYEMRHGLGRGTPNALMASGTVEELMNKVMAMHPTTLIINSLKPKFNPAPLSMYDRRIVNSCPRCGDAVSYKQKCECYKIATYAERACRLCGLINETPNPKNCPGRAHCRFCCDCWYGGCGCGQVYEPNEAPFLHYEWRMGDTMHREEVCNNCINCCLCFRCECGDVHMGRGKTARCTLCKSTNHVVECCDNPSANFQLADAKRPTLPRFRKYSTITFYESGTFTKNQSKRYLSPEIEISGYRVTDWRYYTGLWNTLKQLKAPVVRDLSIPDGFEINMPPANGDKFLTNLKKVERAVKLTNPQTSERTGLHVHTDARDYSADDLAKLLRLFCMVEPMVYRMVAAERRVVKYCVSSRDYLQFGKPKMKLHDLYYFLYGGQEEFFQIRSKLRKNTSSQAIRYRGLNLHTFFYRGTLEFRHHEGTVSAREIGNWSMFCGFLVDIAKVLPWDVLLEIPNIESVAGFKKALWPNLPPNTPNLNLILPYIGKRLHNPTDADDVDGEEPEQPERAGTITGRTHTATANLADWTGFLDAPQPRRPLRRNWVRPPVVPPLPPLPQPQQPEDADAGLEFFDENE